jgi:hypothetical protein
VKLDMRSLHGDFCEMTLEQCIVGLISLAQSHPPDPDVMDRMDILVDAYLVGRNVAAARDQLAREFRERTPVTDLRNRMLDKLVFGHHAV